MRIYLYQKNKSKWQARQAKEDLFDERARVIFCIATYFIFLFLLATN
jgi:hypothetical protein